MHIQDKVGPLYPPFQKCASQQQAKLRKPNLNSFKQISPTLPSLSLNQKMTFLLAHMEHEFQILIKLLVLYLRVLKTKS
jgi:hypothetical protein